MSFFVCRLQLWLVLRSIWQLWHLKVGRRVEQKPSGSPASARGTRSPTLREYLHTHTHRNEHAVLYQLWSPEIESWSSFFATGFSLSYCWIMKTRYINVILFCVCVFAETQRWRRRRWVSVIIHTQTLQLHNHWLNYQSCLNPKAAVIPADKCFLEHLSSVCFLGGESCKSVCVFVGRRWAGNDECVWDNDTTDGVGFPRFILVLLRRRFWDILAAAGEVRN